ncbi:hypothetical protein [Streptomyces cahuitamycinicus]|uniref:Uncharacterized protein n=1 Tax=Streptomyces cahuitamycinicus TaxID=2070367 RepID=A0A2N8TTL1_9ACTN|nr:hypothetical protein [Streptomyces cahuitamycinicus]PNG22323.1 hypothetical protein C1J00_09925 [Streptomyces cahuitamycinicus]
MSPRITVRARVRRPRGLRLGPWLLWAVRLPDGPNLGVGRIAVTDTPGDPAPGQTRAQDGQGRVLVVGGVAFTLLRCRSVPVRRAHS